MIKVTCIFFEVPEAIKHIEYIFADHVIADKVWWNLAEYWL